MPRLVIDYDTYAYSVGFASETRSIVATHKNSGIAGHLLIGQSFMDETGKVGGLRK